MTLRTSRTITAVHLLEAINPFLEFRRFGNGCAESSADSGHGFYFEIVRTAISAPAYSRARLPEQATPGRGPRSVRLALCRALPPIHNGRWPDRAASWPLRPGTRESRQANCSEPATDLPAVYAGPRPPDKCSLDDSSVAAAFLGSPASSSMVGQAFHQQRTAPADGVVFFQLCIAPTPCRPWPCRRPPTTRRRCPVRRSRDNSPRSACLSRITSSYFLARRSVHHALHVFSPFGEMLHGVLGLRVQPGQELLVELLRREAQIILDDFRGRLQLGEGMHHLEQSSRSPISRTMKLHIFAAPGNRRRSLAKDRWDG